MTALTNLTSVLIVIIVAAILALADTKGNHFSSIFLMETICIVRSGLTITAQYEIQGQCIVDQKICAKHSVFCRPQPTIPPPEGEDPAARGAFQLRPLSFLMKRTDEAGGRGPLNTD